MMAFSAFIALLNVFVGLAGSIVVQILNCVVLWSKFPVIICVKVGIDVINICCLVNLTKLRSIPIVPNSKLSFTF